MELEMDRLSRGVAIKKVSDSLLAGLTGTAKEVCSLAFSMTWDEMFDDVWIYGEKDSRMAILYPEQFLHHVPNIYQYYTEIAKREFTQFNQKLFVRRCHYGQSEFPEIRLGLKGEVIEGILKIVGGQMKVESVSQMVRLFLINFIAEPLNNEVCWVVSPSHVSAIKRKLGFKFDCRTYAGQPNRNMAA